MARLPYLSVDDVAPRDRDLLSRNLNLYYELAHSPNAARAFAAPAMYVRHDSPLDPRLRELAILQVGYSTNTEYEYAHHIEIGLNIGLTEDDIRAIRLETNGDPTHLNELDRAVCRAAREIVAEPAMSDETFAILSATLDETSLVDLVMVISFYCAVVRLLGVLQIDLEDGYRHYLESFPLPS